ACFPRSWPGCGHCPHPPDLRLLSPRLPVPAHGPPALTAERPSRTANPAPGPPACPLPAIPAHQDHLPKMGSAHRAIRGFESDAIRISLYAKSGIDVKKFSFTSVRALMPRTGSENNGLWKAISGSRSSMVALMSCSFQVAMNDLTISNEFLPTSVSDMPISYSCLS